MSEEEHPKIIIDEDWKARVQREKEEAKKAAAEGGEGEKSKKTDKQPEEASFEGLVSGLGMQGMIALAVIAPRDTKEMVVDLPGAKYVIDTLMILRDKTKGNLTPEEQGYLTQMLADLQQAFVVRSQQVHEAALRNAGIKPDANM